MSPQHTLYFITNDAAGNYVVAASVNADGLLTGATSTYAGGVGVHDFGPIVQGPDGTFSQGIVQVHQERNLLATVNTVNHTAVLFSINPFDPTLLTMVGKPVSTQGDSPNSVAFNRAGDTLCVQNTGAKNGVACFDVTKAGLKLQNNTVRELGLFNQTVPATGPFNTASQIAFTNDQKNILVAVKGTLSDPGFFALWSFDQSGGLSANYTRIAPPTGAGLPFSLTNIRGTDAFMAVDFALGLDIIDFSAGITADTVRIKAVPIPGQQAACWSTYSSARNSYYAVDTSADVVTEVRIDNALGTSVVNNFTLPDAPIDSIAISVGRKSYFYTLFPTLVDIGVWDLDATPKPALVSLVSIAALTQNSVPLTPGGVQGMAAYTHRV
ncbi:hypothetical protein PENSPDRAFT_685357 [Peniophora sp. CONT]|nr:hypothetical protein PENSPDRAFT_685357 [Peniophora sp. CONT]